MVAAKRLKNPRADRAGRLQVYRDDAPPPDKLHPAFCFRHLSDKKQLKQPRVKERKAKISDMLHSLGSQRWSDIKQNRHESGGYETRADLNDTGKVALPPGVNVIVFRVGDKGRMGGYRILKVFYILWFDWSPFTVYKHS